MEGESAILYRSSGDNRKIYIVVATYIIRERGRAAAGQPF